MKIAFTYFNAFGGDSVNSAALAAALLPKQIDGAEVITAQIPTEYDGCFTAVKALLDSEKPDILLMLGQAAGRTYPQPEKVAVNFDSSQTPDNAGVIRASQVIFPDGPDAVFTPLDVNGAVEACRESGIPASVSYSAGTFVCNHIFYTALLYISRNRMPTEAGFIHLPATPQQACKRNMASMPSELSCAAVVAMARVFINNFNRRRA